MNPLFGENHSGINAAQCIFHLTRSILALQKFHLGPFKEYLSCFNCFLRDWVMKMMISVLVTTGQWCWLPYEHERQISPHGFYLHDGLTEFLCFPGVECRVVITLKMSSALLACLFLELWFVLVLLGTLITHVCCHVEVASRSIMQFWSPADLSCSFSHSNKRKTNDHPAVLFLGSEFIAKGFFFRFLILALYIMYKVLTILGRSHREKISKGPQTFYSECPIMNLEL